MSLRAFAAILAGLFLTAGLFSAVCLALSTYARTYKEGQNYLTPALLVVMPLGMVALLPNVKPDLGLALVPVANLAGRLFPHRRADQGQGQWLRDEGVFDRVALAALQW